MANVMHQEATRTGLARLPVSADDTPRDGQPEHLDRRNDGDMGLDTSRMSAATVSTNDALGVLQQENAELRRRLEELEAVLLDSGDGDDAAHAELEREFERLLDQKSETIRELHGQLQELRQAAAAAPAAGPAAASAPAQGVLTEEEYVALQREIEEERRRLDEERAQLKEDEQALMTQMREMEMSLSRDRAELARQRTELQRLHGDLNREIEQAGRDSGLRERLLALRRGPELTREAPPPAPLPAAAASPPQASPPPKAESSIKKSGMFRRIFGG